MGIDIDSFLNKLGAKEEAANSAKENNDTANQVQEKVNLEFDQNVSKNLKEIEDSLKEKDLMQLKEIYDDLKKFDETIPSKFLTIQTTGSSTIDALNNQYSVKLLSTLQNNATIITSKIEENNIKIQEDLISKQYRVSIKLIKENKELLNQFPNEFSNEKHVLKLSIRKNEIRINQEIRNFKLQEAQQTKKILFSNLKHLKLDIERNNIDEIEMRIKEIELNLQKIPAIFRSVFIDENILIQKAIANAEQKILEIQHKQFDQKEKEIKITQEKFQNALIKKDLNSVLLLYNEILLLFEDLPNTNFKQKITHLPLISKLHSQLNSLYVKNNVELLLRSYNNSKVIEEARNYIDHIEITKKVSPENISLIYEKLKTLPRSTHIEQESMIKKYELLINKIKNHNPIIDRAEEYLHSKDVEPSQSRKFKPTSNKNNTTPNTQSPELLSKQHSIKMDNNVANEIENLYLQLKKETGKKEKSVIYKKIFFYLDLINLPEEKKKKIQDKVKKVYSGE